MHAIFFLKAADLTMKGSLSPVRGAHTTSPEIRLMAFLCARPECSGNIQAPGQSSHFVSSYFLPFPFDMKSSLYSLFLKNKQTALHTLIDGFLWYVNYISI